MNIKNVLQYLVIILVGPIATFFTILSGKGFKMKMSYLFVVGLGAAIAVVVNLAVNSAIKMNLKRAVTISIIITEVIYLLILIVGSLNSPEDLMWLPVALIFLPIFSLPTALSVSYGISKLIKDTEEQNAIAS